MTLTYALCCIWCEWVCVEGGFGPLFVAVALCRIYVRPLWYVVLAAHPQAD